MNITINKRNEERLMKKILVLLCTCTLVLSSMCGCSSDQVESENTASTESESQKKSANAPDNGKSQFEDLNKEKENEYISEKDIDSVYENADNYIGKYIVVSGIVSDVATGEGDMYLYLYEDIENRSHNTLVRIERGDNLAIGVGDIITVDGCIVGASSDEGIELGIEAQNVEKVQDDNIINFRVDNFSTIYTRHEFGTDWEGQKCLIYYYTFTNNSDTNTSASVAAYIQCFQNGIECDTSFLSTDNEYIDNYSKDVQPGTSIEVCQVFVLQDDSEITVEASDWASFSDDKDIQKISVE